MYAPIYYGPCQNHAKNNGSHNKLLCKSFFEEAQKLTESYEKMEVDKLFMNLQQLAALKYDDILENKNVILFHAHQVVIQKNI